jgi:hypothetical protein
MFKRYGRIVIYAVFRIFPEVLIIVIALIAFFAGLFPPFTTEAKGQWLLCAAVIFFLVVVSRFVQECFRVSKEMKIEDRFVAVLAEGNRRSSELMGVISALAGGAVRLSTFTFANNALEFGDRILHYAYESRSPVIVFNPKAADIERERQFDATVIETFKRDFGKELRDFVDGLLLSTALPQSRDFYLNPKTRDDLFTIARDIMIVSYNLRSKEEARQ